MSRLIDTDDAYKILTEYYHQRTEMQHKALRNALDRVPGKEIIHCKDCKNSEHWYRDRRRCFLWAEEGVSVFDDGFCNYAESKD